MGVNDHEPNKRRGPVVTLDASTGGFDIVVDATSVYWSDGGALIKKVPIGGGAITTLASGQNGARGMAIDGSNVYWGNTDSVMKVPIAGWHADAARVRQPR